MLGEILDIDSAEVAKPKVQCYLRERNALEFQAFDDIPAEVPEFTYGMIDGATISDVDNKIAYTFKIPDLSIDALKAYDKDLKAKGFESVLMLIGDKGGTITAEKDGLSVALMGGDGNGSLSVQIPKK